jgi:hypothetical protein
MDLVKRDETVLPTAMRGGNILRQGGRSAQVPQLASIRVRQLGILFVEHLCQKTNRGRIVERTRTRAT